MDNKVRTASEVMKDSRTSRLEWIEMNVRPENRTRIAFIYGAFEPFRMKLEDRQIINSIHRHWEYDASKPQGVFVRFLDPKYAKDPLEDGYEINIYEDETVTMEYKFSFGGTSPQDCVESYVGNFQSVLNWMSAGCDVDNLRNYLDVVIHE